MDSAVLEELAPAGIACPARTAASYITEDLDRREQDAIPIDVTWSFAISQAGWRRRATIAKQTKGWECQGIVRPERTGYDFVLHPQELTSRSDRTGGRGLTAPRPTRP
ncbi:MAG: hypothetical protein J2P47_10435 [Acetobacteraceae bacterium]|nr:hypothetical protein [Acetobacteraceae bacterium]